MAPHHETLRHEVLWRSVLLAGLVVGLVVGLFLPEVVLAQPNMSGQPLGPGQVNTASSGAAVGVGGVLDNVLVEIKRTFDGVGDRLGDIAWAALLSLLVVDFVLRAGRAIIGDDSVSGLIRGFAFQIGFVAMIAGFIAIVPAFVDFLAETAIRIGREAGSPDAAPSNLVVAGLTRALGWLGEISIWSPGSVFFVVAAAISVVVLAATVAMMIVVWAELYLSALAGMVTLMFAGLTETRSIALDYINALVGKSFKLLGLLIIVEATSQMTQGLAEMDGAGFGAAMGMIMLQIVSLVLILTLPPALEALVGNKFASKSAETIGKGAMTGAKVAGAAGIGAAAVGTTRAVSQGMEASALGGKAADIAKASVQGLGAGLRDGGIGTGATVARQETMKKVGRQIADRLGHKGGGE